MPRRIEARCGWGGGACGAEAVPGTSRCERHLSDDRRRYNQRRDPRLQAFYGSQAWLRLRRAVLVEEPTCRCQGLCGRHAGPCGRPSTDVDHVVAMHDGGAGLARSNVQGLCSSCHDRKSAAERRSRARARARDTA